MVKFEYVEEYIEFMLGGRDLNGNKIHSWNIIPPIRLARHDVTVIRSFSTQASNGIGYTDRQFILAATLIDKYRRQLTACKVVVPADTKTLPTRNAIRAVNRTKQLYYKDELLVLKFPFSNEIIHRLEKIKKSSRSVMCFFVREERLWYMHPVPENIIEAIAIATKYDFDIDPAIQEDYDAVMAIKSKPYNIQIRIANNELVFDNVPKSAIDYIKSKVDGVGLNNLLQVADVAARCGVSLSDEILSTVRAPQILANTSVYVDPESGVASIVDFATTYNKFPIVSVEVSRLGTAQVDLMRKKFQADEIVDLIENPNAYISPATKLICVTSKDTKQIDFDVPLLVLYGTLGMGASLEMLKDRSQRIVYCCNSL